MSSIQTSTLAAVASAAIEAAQPATPAQTATAPEPVAPAVTPAAPAPISTEALAAAREDGASAERLRVKAILSGPEAEGRSALAQHLAFSTAMSADAASAVLAASPRASASRSLTGATVPQPAVASVEPAQAAGQTPAERLAAACKALTPKS